MKFVLVPDSFKGTLSSKKVCEIMTDAIKSQLPSADVVSIPVADGGEGTVDAFLAVLGGTKKRLMVCGPHFEKVEAFYAISNRVAIIELAAAAGLNLAGENSTPYDTTTFGVGEIIADAIKSGCKKIIVGLGGSCTNDGGCGIAAALGVKFYNKSGASFIPVGGTLCDITGIDTSGLFLSNVQIVTMCDITNPLYGRQGAAYVFAPQKGADDRCVEKLDENLRKLDDAVQHTLGISAANKSGAGAAGGAGYAMSVFLSSDLSSGIETLLDAARFDDLLSDVDYVISGEGKIDSQSIHGKVLSGVARHTAAANVPLIAVGGDIDLGAKPLYSMGVTAMFSTNRLALPFEKAKHNAAENLYSTTQDILRLIKTKRTV